MDVKLMNPFINAASEVLAKEIQGTITKGQISLKTSAHTTEEVTILFGLIGQIEGMVAYGASKDTARAFVSKMMGQEFDVLDSLAQSVVSELGNIIAGLARTELSDQGYKINISSPMLVLNKGVLISTLDLQRLVVPLETPHGPVQVHFSLQERKEKS